MTANDRDRVAAIEARYAQITARLENLPNGGTIELMMNAPADLHWLMGRVLDLEARVRETEAALSAARTALDTHATEIFDTIGWYASENYYGAHAQWQQAWQSAGEVCQIAEAMQAAAALGKRVDGEA